MKTKLLLGLLLLGLIGCSSVVAVDWHQESKTRFMGELVSAHSRLWISSDEINGHQSTPVLNGVMMLQAPIQLPADLAVQQLSLRQGGQQYHLDDNGFEVNTQSQKRWQIVFHQPVTFDTKAPVDLALLLEDEGQKKWLVETQVSIDIVE